MIEVKINGTVDKPIQDLWNVTVQDFDKVGLWATGVFKSYKGENHDRICETSFGKLYENMVVKDEQNHHIEVDAKGFPFFVTKATGHWTFNKITDSKTEFVFGIKLDTMPVIGSLMGLMMKPKLNKALQGTANDYKTYLETGKVSDVKQREIDSLKN